MDNTLLKVSIFTIYICLSLFGLFKLKEASYGLNFDFIFGFFCYGFGFVVWLVVLKLYPLSIAFPIAAGMLMVGTQIIGAMLLKEHVGLMNVGGVTLIWIGVIYAVPCRTHTEVK